MSDRHTLTSELTAPSWNLTEDQERTYHTNLTRKIAAALKAVHNNVVSRHEEMMEIKQQIQEHARDLDHVDKANLRQAADMASRVGEHSIERRRKLTRLLESPYFGRIDVTGAETLDNGRAEPIYIGVHSFAEIDSEQPLIHDWRAPISSMFYDFELGEAYYEAPGGRIDCEVTLKRQYKIEKQQFRFMLESALNIQDNILQEELSRASDDKLKTIVATIQRDQNAIIRNERSQTLVIVRKELRQMFADTNLRTIYKNFYTWVERPEMFNQGAKGALEYADVFPLVYLKVMLEGTSSRSDIKHVVIDEMQDYTPVQYQVFCSDSEYSSAIDRHMLYVAVTRAMHTLAITHTGERTEFLHAAARV